MEKPKILIIYTGGTIGMGENPTNGKLSPVIFDDIEKIIPEIGSINAEIGSIELDEIIDSANFSPKNWINLANLIGAHYHDYDGFVILHGTDTMAYTASALSFILHGLNKPVIFTGSQLPLGKIRTDGKENLITSLEIAATHTFGHPLLSEVCVFFENDLYRGNRCKKKSAELFDAFESPNYPKLAEAGIEILYNYSALKKWSPAEFSVHQKLEEKVAVIFLHPSLSHEWLDKALDENLVKGAILLTYGSGNAPTHKAFLNVIEQKIKAGICLVNLTQCSTGSVNNAKYETGYALEKLGVISGIDLTVEAAVTKLMYLLSFNYSKKQLQTLMQNALRGELTEK